MKVYDAIARALSECGVDTLFGVIGDANMMHVAAFIDEHHGRYISAVHEAGALAMADGYSRFSGRPGVASVTHGPGVTNTMTALTEAVRARSAVLVLTGDPPPVRNYSQRIDLQAAANLTGAGHWRVLTAEHTVDDIAMILDRIQSERRPTLMDISATIQAADVEYRSPRRRSIVSRPECVPDEAGLDKALGVIASSSRIVILAGRGATEPDARTELADLADQLGAVLATTLLAKDLFRDHPYNVGLIGTTAADLSFDVIARADCIVAFGAGLGRHTTSTGTLFGGKAVIHIDTDPDAIGRDLPAAAVVGDSANTARTMRERLAEADHQPGTSLRTDALRNAIAASKHFDPSRDVSGNGDGRHPSGCVPPGRATTCDSSGRVRCRTVQAGPVELPSSVQPAPIHPYGFLWIDRTVGEYVNRGSAGRTGRSNNLPHRRRSRDDEPH